MADREQRRRRAAPDRAEIAAQGGPAVTDAWWANVDGSPGQGMPDEAVDWIEEAANNEVEGAQR